MSSHPSLILNVLPEPLVLGHLGLLLDADDVVLVGDLDLVGHHHPDVPIFLFPTLST